MSKTLFAAVLLVSGFAAAAAAAPGAVTGGLMAEPASLFDVGMVRLENLTTDFQRRVGLHWTGDDGNPEFFRASISTEYDRDLDRLFVHFLIMNSAASPAQMEEGCENATRQMGYWLGKSLPKLFSHVGDRSRWTELHQAFRELVVMRCYVSSGENSSVGRFWASRALGDPELSVGPWATR